MQDGARRSGEPLIAASGIWKIFGPKADRILGTADAELTRAALARVARRPGVGRFPGRRAGTKPERPACRRISERLELCSLPLETSLNAE